LKLGLAAAKHVEKIPYQDNVIYSFATKRDDWPQFYVCIADAYAYGSSDLSRIEQIQSDSGSGPLFLKKIAAKAIPENTFLLLESNEPAISGYLHGANHSFQIDVNSVHPLPGELPDIPSSASSVLSVQTNATGLVRQPSASFVLEKQGSDPVANLNVE